MKLRLLAGALSLALSLSPAFAQVNPGTSPLSGSKGGTGNAFMQFTGPASTLKTFTLPNASGTIDLLNAVQTFTAAKTFADATLLLAGSSSGTTMLKAQAAASGILMLPAATDTLVARTTADTLTNKTLTNPVFTVGSPTGAATMGFNAAGGPPNYGDGSANHVLAVLDVSQTFSGNNTFTGRGIFAGTSAPASTAGNTVVLGTLASPPTLSNNGQAFVYSTSSGGAILQGAGSVYDLILMNKTGGTIAAAVPTGLQTLAMPNMSSGTCVNAVSLDSSSNMVKSACAPSLGTGVATALGNALSSAGGVTSTIASGTAALGTSAISSAACATVVTVAATNTATTDVVLASFNGDPTAVTGYVPSTNGMLTIFAYPTAGNVNFKVCNNTSASVTPGAITLNWRVVR